jgi:hypothetical protein
MIMNHTPYASGGSITPRFPPHPEHIVGKMTVGLTTRERKNPDLFSQVRMLKLVAGAGFEPTTSGLLVGYLIGQHARAWYIFNIFYPI